MSSQQCTVRCKKKMRDICRVALACILWAGSWTLADAIDADLFLQDCPAVRVTDGTEVSGTATVSGICTVSVDADVILKFKDVHLTTESFTITGSGALVEIKENSTWKAHGDFSMHLRNGEAMVKTTQLTANSISLQATDLTVKDSLLEAATGDLTMTAWERDILVERSTGVALNDMETTAVDLTVVKDSTLTAGSSMTMRTSAGKTAVDRGTLTATLDLAIEATHGNTEADRSALGADRIKISVTNGQITAKLGTFTASSGIEIRAANGSAIVTCPDDRPVRVAATTKVKANTFRSPEVTISSDSETAVTDNDFAGVSAVTISGDDKCESAGNTPDISCI
jgi:hypothetical protein